MENPFRFGGELTQDELVDRQEELQQVVETIRNGEKLFLIGPRRYGKTSILHAASQVAREQGATVFRYNCEAFPTLRDLQRFRFECSVSLKFTNFVSPMKFGFCQNEFFFA